jgi:uncharacterized membrane protein
MVVEIDKPKNIDPFYIIGFQMKLFTIIVFSLILAVVLGIVTCSNFPHVSGLIAVCGPDTFPFLTFPGAAIFLVGIWWLIYTSRKNRNNPSKVDSVKSSNKSKWTLVIVGAILLILSRSWIILIIWILLLLYYFRNPIFKLFKGADNQ